MLWLYKDKTSQSFQKETELYHTRYSLKQHPKLCCFATQWKIVLTCLSFLGNICWEKGTLERESPLRDTLSLELCDICLQQMLWSWIHFSFGTGGCLQQGLRQQIYNTIIHPAGPSTISFRIGVQAVSPESETWSRYALKHLTVWEGAQLEIHNTFGCY